MKITQYVTTDGAAMVSYELEPMGTAMAGAKTLVVADAPRDGSWIGFGAAVTGSSCWLLNRMNPETRARLLREAYADDGLRLSVGRISVGASDYSPSVYSYDDLPDDRTLSHFSIERDEAYVLPMLKEVQKVQPELYWFSSPWTPPAWMKTGFSLCGGYMREPFLEVYADYYVKFLAAYRAHGIRISALTPQNEPENEQYGKMPACVWTPDLESRFALILKEKLKQAGLDTEIWLFDHSFYSIDRVLWCLTEYPALADAIGGVALHYYGGTPEQLDKIAAKYPALPFHFTEGGPRLYDHYDNDWCKWGILINRALTSGCRSFTGWNLVLDERGGPNNGPFFCGGLFTYRTESGELGYSGQYKALRHYSRFLQRGARIYPCEIPYDGEVMQTFNREAMTAPLSVSVAKNPDGSTVIHAVNANKSKRQMQFFRDGRWWYVECMPNSLNTITITE